MTECDDHIGLAAEPDIDHLSCLADCGYVHVRRAGRYAYYRVADPTWPTQTRGMSTSRKQD